MGIGSRRGSDPWPLVEPVPIIERRGASGVRATVAEVLIAFTLVLGPQRDPGSDVESPHAVVEIVDIPSMSISLPPVASLA